MWETIRGYLTFTRKERFGVLFLLLVISILFILPYFIGPSVGDPDPAAYDSMKNDIKKFQSGPVESSSPHSAIHAGYTDSIIYKPSPKYGLSLKTVHTEMFYFDPNQMSGNDWLRLGLSESLTRTILHYIEKGGRFRKAEDLKKLYGLHSPDYERLLPYVRITGSLGNPKADPANNKKFTDYSGADVKEDSVFQSRSIQKEAWKTLPYKTKKYEITDINTADSEVWSDLPGIGATLASRIVHYREKLGGFYQTDQVGETFGLPDSVFQKIKSFLRINTVSVSRIDLNSATREVLQAHPYIRWQIARAIVDYRAQHGRFNTVGDLLQIALIDPAKFEKIKPYVNVKP
jgi:competence protein ComEA